MKIYTEEEILSMLKIHLADEEQADSFVALLTPIELPSDEEIENMIGQIEYEYAKIGFRAFAKFLINKIQGGNNE